MRHQPYCHCPACVADLCALCLRVRFLDAQRITSLTRYLEQLHACGLAGADHTTLLLNCYTKLKDVAKLDAFIHRCRGRFLGGWSKRPSVSAIGTADQVLRPAVDGFQGQMQCM